MSEQKCELDILPARILQGGHTNEWPSAGRDGVRAFVVRENEAVTAEELDSLIRSNLRRTSG